ncbi:MAG: hypothetical protein ACKO6N_03970 [Myxococcota bacterium]
MRAFKIPTRLLLSLLAVSSMTGCLESTCETACSKAVNDCGVTWTLADKTPAEHYQACLSSCSADMLTVNQEAQAGGWVACVESFQCSSTDDGLQLCLTCQAGYYVGRSEPPACTYAESTARSAW